LIDGGGNLPARLRKADLDPQDVTDIIVTHSHPDHTYGLPFLSHSFYHSHLDVSCWSTDEAIPRLRDSLEAYDLQDPDRYMTMTFESVPTEKPQPLPLVDSLNVSSFPTDHSRDSFGLVLESSDQKIVFTADTKPCEAVKDVSGDADVLIHDCQGLHGYQHYFKESHTSALELGKIADELNVPTLVPFHHNLIELPGGWEEIGTEIREHYDGRIVHPTQGMGFTL
jgi:ribonuclease Z